MQGAENEKEVKYKTKSNAQRDKKLGIKLLSGFSFMTLNIEH